MLESFLTVHYFGAASLLGGAKRGQIDGHVVADFYNTVSSLEAWRHAAWRTRHDWLLEDTDKWHQSNFSKRPFDVLADIPHVCVCPQGSERNFPQVPIAPNDPSTFGYGPQVCERIFLRCQLHQTTLRVSQDWTPRKPKRHLRLQLWLKYRDCDCGSEPGVPNLTFVAF